jgi:hypothetical protein
MKRKRLSIADLRAARWEREARLLAFMAELQTGVIGFMWTELKKGDSPALNVFSCSSYLPR